MPTFRKLKCSIKETAANAGFLAIDCTVQGGILFFRGIETIDAVKIFFQREIDDLYCAECDEKLIPVREFFFHLLHNAPY